MIYPWMTSNNPKRQISAESLFHVCQPLHGVHDIPCMFLDILHTHPVKEIQVPTLS